MRILIDLQGVQTESRFRGIGRYSMALAQAMARQAGDHEIWLLANAREPESIDAIRESFEDLVPASRLCLFDAPMPVSWPDPANAWRRNAAECIRETVLAGVQPDIVHVSSLFEGAQDHATVSIGRLHAELPTAVTLYDLIPLLNQADYLGAGWARDWYMDRIESLKRADLLLAISGHARQEAIDALGIDGDRIVNISSAVSGVFRPRTISTEERSALASRFGIRGPYVMYSGAMESRKNVEGLLKAFSLLAPDTRGRHQLAIVGKIREDHAVRLRSMATEFGFGDRLVLTGYTTDEELVTLYNACALFVFPSLHEGFGLPALEAMSCGAATIGSNTTSIPEVIGFEDALFDPSDASDIARVMGRALEDSGFVTALRQHAPRQAALFSWDACAKRAIAGFEALHAKASVTRRTGWADRLDQQERDYRRLIGELGGVKGKPVAPSHDDLVQSARAIASNQAQLQQVARMGELPEQITWRIEGPFDSSYSLALLNRETAIALDAMGHHVVLHSTEGPGDFQPGEAFLQANPRLAQLHQRCDQVPPAQADVSSRNLYPPRVSDMRSRINMLHHYAWEESGFPPEWVADFNDYLQGMTCLSQHVEKVMIDNGVAVPLSVSGCGVDHWERIVPDDSYRVDAKPFRFLHVSSCFPRKGADVLLRAYGRAFSSRDDVTLVIKTFANPHNEIHKWLEQARAGQADYPDVVIIEDDLSDAQLKALHQQCQVLVAPSRAEGYGLPIAEAMLSGLGVVTTAWGGQRAFCSPETAWLVDYSFAPAETHFDLFNSIWAEPDEEQLASILREVHALPAPALRERSMRGRAELLAGSTWKDVAGRLVDSARVIARSGASPAPKVGWVSSWNAKCGIATYSSHLLGAMPDSDVTVFAARTPVPTALDDARVVRCWDAGDGDRLAELAAAIEAGGVSTLVLQFQYGFFNFDHLSRFLHGQVDAGRSVVLMMHATTDAPETPYKLLRNLVPALARCDRLLVHATADINRLKGLGLVENVALFPHGIVDVPIVERSGAGGPFVICSYGFFLPHKGLLQLIEAVALLVAQGRDIHLRMVNAEFPAPQSRAMIDSAHSTVAALGLQDRVTLMTDFLPDRESLAALGDSDLIVFPYQSTGESSSAAVRYGLATGRPVAVTPLPIFDDVRRAVYELPGQAPGEIAEGIARFMDGNASPNEAARWCDAHRYSRLGERLQAMLAQLARRHG